jgi:DNA-binding NtrC family response regulator
LSAIPVRKRALLIVDDEPDILWSLESLLSYSLPDVKVLTASSGSKGMAIVRTNVLDMILSDFRMDKMDGVQFLRQARAVQADIPMGIMSADADSESARRAFALGDLELVVPKPFDIDALIALVRSFLGGPAAGGAGPSPAASSDGTEESQPPLPRAPPVLRVV